MKKFFIPALILVSAAICARYWLRAKEEFSIFTNKED